MLFIFGALLLIPFLLNLAASRHNYERYVDPLFASGMLGAIWAFSNIVGAFWAFPASMQFNPMVDLIGLSIVVAAYMTQRQRWKLVLAFLFLGQLAAHAIFWWDLRQQAPLVSGRDYVGLLNLLWMAQLICVASPGGGHVASRALLRLRSTGGRPHLAGR